MQLRSLTIGGLYEIVPKRFEDSRGYFSEIFRQGWFKDSIADVDLVQENQSLSVAKGVIRGLHYQRAPMGQGKLVRCLSGSIFDVAVDIRAGSPTFGKWEAVTLSAEAGNQLWIPEGFLHGFCTLEANSVVCYKVTNYYSGEHDAGVAWNDPDIGIAWPAVADASSLSKKDTEQPRLADLPAQFHYSE